MIKNYTHSLMITIYATMVKRATKSAAPKTNENENFYQSLPKEYKSNSFNPNLGKSHHIEIPFRMGIIGASGSGKTNCLLNLLKRFNGTFNHMHLCVKNIHEPLYEMLVDKLGEDITVYEDGIVPPLSEMVPNGEQLIIFDDLVGDKVATPEIIEYYKMARKKNISCIYLSQSFFKIDKFIRQNINYLIIKKVSSKKDLRLILNEYSLNCDLDQLEQIYALCTSKFEDIMLIKTIRNM